MPVSGVCGEHSEGSTDTPINPESEEKSDLVQYPYRLAASTGDVYSGSIADTNAREKLAVQAEDITAKDIPLRRRKRQAWQHAEESNCFRSAQWTADGRYLITNSEDSAVRVFGLPSEWLQECSDKDPKSVSVLRPISVIYEPESVYSIGPCPWVLEDDTMNWFITCTRDNPIHLYSLDGSILSTYILQHAATEKYLSPHSIVFSHYYRHFICGTESMISVFDFNNREPLYNLRTIPSRNSIATTQTMKGILSAMSISPDSGILAAGTYTRSIGLYDQEGSGDVIAIFSVAEKDEKSSLSLKGITDVRWSQCGTYIYVSERKDNVITVWDVRRLFNKVATLRSRDANTVQRLGIDLIPDYVTGTEMVAGGGKDGMIKVWDVNVDTNPVLQWKAHNADPVTSVAVNPAWPSIVATCSGQRNHARRDYCDEESEGFEMDNSLKLWRHVGFMQKHELSEFEPRDGSVALEGGAPRSLNNVEYT
ncbi:WD40-repeat-containing domain protein [Kalaharituber pfeilii]|nr:WD40-repeat-containing domain protein [Kalaharituber pfeilii]